MQIDEYQELRFSKIEDRAHGWLAVPVWFVQELGITVSRYSYISPDQKTAYLEEDADLNAFCAAFNAKFGRQPLWNTDYQANTFVRNLNSYPQSLNPQETKTTNTPDQSVFTKIDDREYGWLAVPVSFVQELGITVSRYSYISPDQKTAYLEESADLRAFCAAFNAKFERPPLWNTDYQARAFVRNLNRYPQSLNPQETTMTTEATTRQILNGHTSKETAYLVNDHPYGSGLRCRIRYWLETAIGGEKKGATRFMAQTTNPRVIGEPWNKPKASTYHHGVFVMYLDEKSHVQWIALNGDSDAEQLEAAKAWQGLSDEQRAEIDHTIEAKAVSAAMPSPYAEA